MKRGSVHLTWFGYLPPYFRPKRPATQDDLRPATQDDLGRTTLKSGGFSPLLENGCRLVDPQQH